MENTLQKIGTFLGKKFAIIDELFAKKADLAKEEKRAISAEKSLMQGKVDKEDGKELMPSPSDSADGKKFLSENGTWKTVDLEPVYNSIGELETEYKTANAELDGKIKEESTRAQNAERELSNGKVDKIEGKGLSVNDYTDEEKTKLENIGPYVKNVSFANDVSTLNILYNNPATGIEQSNSLIFQNANSATQGLMSSKHYDVLENLQKNGDYLDKTGTPSNTWQLSKNTGPKIKNSGGQFELRNSEDSEYANLTLKNITVKGRVAQEGDSFITEAETIEVKDNTILLNKGEVGSGVTKGYAGLEIDRGTEPDYKIIFDESDDRFKAGAGDDLHPILLRNNESELTDGFFLSWDGGKKRAKTTNEIPFGKQIIFKRGGITNDTLIGKLFDKLFIKWDKDSTLSGQIFFAPNGPDFEISSDKNNITFLTPLKAPTFHNSEGKEVAYKDEINTGLENYLPISGGTLTDALNIKSKVLNALKIEGISSDAATDANIRFLGMSSERYANIFYHDDKNHKHQIGFFMDQDSGRLSFIIQKSDQGEEIKFDNKKVWYEGNDGADSGLDADLLDGKQGSEYALRNDIPSLDNYVTLDTEQTINGVKTFTAPITGGAGFYDPSDIRLKKNIKPIKLSSEKIKLYEFDKNGHHSYGVIAQELEKEYPSVVRGSKDGYKMVNYNEILVIKCAELEKRLDELEKNQLANKQYG